MTNNFKGLLHILIRFIIEAKFDSNGIGSIDTILYDNSDENENWLSPTASNVELEPGGKLWPIYYSEELHRKKQKGLSN